MRFCYGEPGLSIPNTKGPKLLCEIQEVAVALILAARDGRKPDEIPSAWLQIILCSNQTWSCCTSVNPKLRVITARPPSHQNFRRLRNPGSPRFSIPSLANLVAMNIASVSRVTCCYNPHNNETNPFIGVAIEASSLHYKCKKLAWKMCAVNRSTCRCASLSGKENRVLSQPTSRKIDVEICYNCKGLPAWRYRLGVRTEDSQSSNPGSIPGSATSYHPLKSAKSAGYVFAQKPRRHPSAQARLLVHKMVHRPP